MDEKMNILPREAQAFLEAVKPYIEDQYQREGLNRHINLLELALYYAASQGDNKMVQDLIKCKAEVNVEIESIVDDKIKKSTPIAIATWDGHLAVVIALLKSNADFNTRDPLKNPLYTMLKSGNFRFLYDLIQYTSEETFNKMLQQITYYHRDYTRSIGWDLIADSKLRTANSEPQQSKAMSNFILFLYYNYIREQAGKGVPKKIKFGLPQEAQILVRSELSSVVSRRAFIQTLIGTLKLNTNQWQKYELLPEFPHLLDILSRLKPERIESLFLVMYAGRHLATELMVDMILVPAIKEMSQSLLDYRDTFSQESFPPLPNEYRKFLAGEKSNDLKIGFSREIKALQDAFSSFLGDTQVKSTAQLRRKLLVKRKLLIIRLCQKLDSCFPNNNQSSRFFRFNAPSIFQSEADRIFYLVRQENGVETFLAKNSIFSIVIIIPQICYFILFVYPRIHNAFSQQNDMDRNNRVYLNSSS